MPDLKELPFADVGDRCSLTTASRLRRRFYLRITQRQERDFDAPLNS